MAGILVYNPSPGETVSKPASNPKSDTAESAALKGFGLGFHYGAKAALSHVGSDVAAG